ncbi:MAG: PAS domain-containing sensor histidine kinase, partial [Chloroflexi bacterium]|nr:PAS domain-containing sensor histidine kinase [Chloroflexota bacterium]
VDLNPAAEKLMGRTRSDLIGQTVYTAFAAVPGIVEKYRDVDQAHGEFIAPSGRVFDLTISPIRDGRSRLTGRVVVLRDVTRLKEAEERVRAYAAELEERNAELDAFAHTVAHDLKGPLNMVMGFSSIAAQDPGISEETEAYLRFVETSALTMDAIIINLLLLATIRDAREVTEPVDMNATVQASLARFYTQLEPFDVMVHDLPPAMGYGPWIEEVFANLIGNAIKYIGDDNPAPCITISGRRVDDWTRYDVADNGMGIAREDQKRLFDMFTRFHGRGKPGSGLGLSIVQRIVAKLGGVVGVESELGQGSTFWFTLPAVTTPHGVKQARLKPERARE